MVDCNGMNSPLSSDDSESGSFFPWFSDIPADDCCDTGDSIGISKSVSSEEEISKEVSERVKTWTELSSQVPQAILVSCLKSFHIDPSQLEGLNLREFVKVDTQWNLLNEGVGVRGLIKKYLDRLNTVRSSCDLPVEKSEKMGMHSCANLKQGCDARGVFAPNGKVWGDIEEYISSYLGKNGNPLSFKELTEFAYTLRNETGIAVSRQEFRYQDSLKLWYITNINVIKKYIHDHIKTK